MGRASPACYYRKVGQEGELSQADDGGQGYKVSRGDTCRGP